MTLPPREAYRAIGQKLGVVCALALVAVAVTAAHLGAQAGVATYGPACEAGDPESCALLGLFYEQGDGAAPDPARAAEAYRRACEGGWLRGCTNLGILYRDGRGVPQDPEQASYFLGGACEEGEPLACDHLRAAGPAVPGPATSYFKAGRIQDEGNARPIAGAILDLPPLGVKVVSDAAGRVELGALPPGRHPVRVEAFGYQPVEGTLQVPGNAELLILLSPASFPDPLARGRIVGRVVDRDANEVLENVQITLANTTRGTLSGGRGEFAFADVEPGLRELRFERIGLGTLTTPVIVQPGGTVDLSVGMSTRAIELGAVGVTVAASAPYNRQGFQDRQRGGAGTFFTPEDLERIQPQTMADILRARVNGVTTVSEFGSGTRVISRRNFGLVVDSASARRNLGPSTDSIFIARYLENRPEYCWLTIYVDGMEVPEFDIESMDPEDVEAIEVYNGLQAPMEFTRNPCGVVLIWTRLYAQPGG